MRRAWLCFVVTAITGCVATCFSQLPIYNADFKMTSDAIRTKGEFADSLKIMSVVDRTYEIEGAKVIEYYERSSARFLGFAGDTTQFELRRLPYLTRTPMMRRLVKQFGPAFAHDIRQGAFHQGMQLRDVIELHGWPDNRRREGRKKIWTYDDFVLTFEKRELVNVVKTQKGS